MQLQSSTIINDTLVITAQSVHLCTGIACGAMTDSHVRHASPNEPQNTAGDDRLAKSLHQGSDCEEASMLHHAPRGQAAWLLKSDRHGLVTETPRGIVAKSVVERIIAEL